MSRTHLLKESAMALPVPPPSARILVSEDDPIQAAVIASILQQEGYQVETRGTLGDTRAALQADLPDLLLLDRMLPDGDGCLLCQELKADTATQGLPIIMLTARGRVEDRVEGLLRGADDYILKPFHPKELLARVHGALRTLSLQRELRQKAEELEQQHQMLVATQEQLVRSQRLAAIGEIGLAIRHEINNPLGSILGFVDLLIAQGEALPENARRKFDAIRRATIRIRDVVRRLEDIQEEEIRHACPHRRARVAERPAGLHLIPFLLQDGGDQRRLAGIIFRHEDARRGRWGRQGHGTLLQQMRSSHGGRHLRRMEDDQRVIGSATRSASGGLGVEQARHLVPGESRQGFLAALPHQPGARVQRRHRPDHAPLDPLRPPGGQDVIRL